MKKCYHCELPIIKNQEYYIDYNEKRYIMCCPGCRFVFKFIIDSGFVDYYTTRSAPGNKVDDKFHNNYQQLNSFKVKTIKKNYNTNIKNQEYNTINLLIDGITCTACTWLIERHLNNLDYVKKININIATNKLNIIWQKNHPINKLLDEIRNLGYKVYPYTPKKQEISYQNEYKLGLKNLIISGLGMSQVMMLSFALYIGEFNDIQFSYWCFIRWISFLITTLVLFFSGKKIIFSAIRSIKNKSLGMDFTISISLILAYISSILNLVYNQGHVYFDSICMFIFFLLIARFLEMKTKHHSMEVIHNLQELTTGTARKILNNKEKTVPINNIKVTDNILIKPGEIIPVDGIIIKGFSNVDESMLTGEFKLINKFLGNKVMGGTVNGENSIIITATHTVETSKLSYIIQLLEKINTNKIIDNPFINIIANYFVVSVLITVVVAFFIWINIEHTKNILDIILAMLVIACPCALSLSIPIAIITSINTLSKIGFIIVRDNAFDILSKTSDIVFDKTGTLTINKYFIKNIKLFKNISIKKVLTLVNDFERHSTHPIAKAFNNINKKYLHIIKNEKNVIQNLINKGLIGIFNKKTYNLGNLQLTIKKLNKKILLFKNNVSFFITLSDNNGLIACFNLINPLRKNMKIYINKIKKLNLKTHILTGDSSNKIFVIAKKLNIDFIKNNCSVKDKVKYLTILQKQDKCVMMVGDGINDAPALSKANISVAMGSGSDLAKINADSIILNNNLDNIHKAIKHSVKTKNIINQNIVWAILYNFFGLMFASLGFITPYYAAIGMSLSSLLVVLNSLRLNRM